MDPVITTEFLTKEDIEHIKSCGQNLPAFIQMCDLGTKHFLGEYRWTQPLCPIWLAEGLAVLSEDHWDSPYDPDALVGKTALTVEQVIENFNKRWQEAWDGEIEDWKDDPEDYAHFKKLAVIPTEPPGHPWGEEVTKRCRLWMSLTPYRIWWAYFKARQAGVRAFEDEMVLFARDEGEPSVIRDAVYKGFKEEVLAAVGEEDA